MLLRKLYSQMSGDAHAPDLSMFARYKAGEAAKNPRLLGTYSSYSVHQLSLAMYLEGS